jgi:alpha-D-xyloside xylohydrolase
MKKIKPASICITGIFTLILFASPLFAQSGIEQRSAEENGKLIYRNNGQTIVIEAWGIDGFRVRIIPEGGGQTSDWALDIPIGKKGDVKINHNEATIRNGKISATLSDIDTQEGSIEFFRYINDKKISVLKEFDYAVWANNPGSRTFEPTADGLNLFRAELSFAPDNSERLYGMGENATAGNVNLKGSVIDLYQRHVKAVIPFVVSSKMYGFLWNNPSLGRAEFGNNKTRWISEGCRQMDFFITVGDSYADIMEHYADATGHAPAFPFWASGFWQCKLRYENQQQFLDVAREFKKRKLPLSVLVIDYLHWDIQGNWKLDPKFWPDPEAMVKEMNEMGVRIMISPWTLVDEKSENFAWMKEHGLFTGSIGGKNDMVDFNGPKYQYDPTNPEAAKYLWSKWKENYVDIGIKTFWLDPCDEYHEVQDYDKVLFHSAPAKEAHAFFPVAHQKNIYEGLVAAGEKEVVTICRNAWAGSQRYGACPAPHDILSSFEHLDEYMKVGLNVSMSGIPWWSCDIGGFVTNDNSSPRFHELMIRWYQYGVFNPVFRTHGYRPNNEPWNIGGDSYPHIRAAILLREHLRPYVMEQMKIASEKGIPVMRPLFFDFDSDPKVAAINDEFLFGPDFLIAPITKFGIRNREVYLPAGTNWIDAWTGERKKGGHTIKADAPIEHIPIYVRADKTEHLELFKNLYEK